MHILNRSCFIFLVSAILIVSQVALADESTAPEITGITSSIADNYTGTIAVTYQDADGADTVESIQLRIGNSSNQHVMYVFVDLKDGSVKIKTDDGDWKEWNKKNKNLANDYFTITPAQMQHSCHDEYGWLVIPIRFKIDAILENPAAERFMIAAIAKDADGNRSRTELRAAAHLISDDEIVGGSILDGMVDLYKWDGWGGKKMGWCFTWHHFAMKRQSQMRPTVVTLTVRDDYGSFDDKLFYTSNGDIVITSKEYNIDRLQFYEHDGIGTGFVTEIRLQLSRKDKKPLPLWFEIKVAMYPEPHVIEQRISHFLKVLVPTWWIPSLITINP